MTPVERIHITGGQGSGKSTLSARLSATCGLPVHEVDRIARIGGGNGPERAAAERDALVAAIAGGDRWVSEGVHLGWTSPLLERAQVIVWLDQLTPAAASVRMVRRFLSGAMTELRGHHGRERFARVGDYLRHTRELAGALRHARRANDPDLFARALAPYGAKVVRCRTSADLEAFVASLLPAAADVPATSPLTAPTASQAPAESGR